MKKNHIFFVIFSIEILSLLITINCVSFYVQEKVKDNSSNSKLSFTINGRIDEGFNEDKLFKIQTELYKDDKLLKEKNIECTINKNPDADFGASSVANCEINLIYLSDADTIKFIDFIINDDKLQIKDSKNYVLKNTLKITKKNEIETRPDIEFNAIKIKSLKCEGDDFMFGIDGEIDKMYVSKFTFDLDINSIKAKCICPERFLYFSKSLTINCTITIEKSEAFMEKLKNGIEIKESLYKYLDKNNNEKTLKIRIKGNKENIVFKDFNCNSNKDKDNESKEKDMEKYVRKSNRGYENENKKEEDSEITKSIKNLFKDNEKIKSEEDDNQRRWEREREEERRRKREKEEKEKEEERKKKLQEDLEKMLRQRQKQMQKEKEEKENKNNDYDDKNLRRKDYRDNNQDNYNQRNNKDDDIIDYNSNVKLVHLQVRYSYGFIYYLFYALTPVPIGHKIKARFSISKYNYDTGYNDQQNKYIILKTEEEINPNGKNIIIEYLAKYECEQCKKFVLDRNSIEGAKVYNIPEENLDAIATNQKQYLTKDKMENPPLYITDNIFNSNCKVILNGNFFNKNRFYASKFALNLKSASFYGNNKDIKIYCGLNERGVFECPINDNINNYEYKLEPLIIDDKENIIIIDNSNVAKIGMFNQVSCLPKIDVSNNNLLNNDKNNKLNENVNGKKMSTFKKLLFGIIIIIILYCLISKCCCSKEEERDEEYNPRWRVSSSNYGGESYGFRNRW